MLVIFQPKISALIEITTYVVYKNEISPQYRNFTSEECTQRESKDVKVD